MSKIRLLILIPVIALVLSGCGPGGPPVGTVTGIVKLDDKPMPKLQITFVPKAGGPTSTGVTNSEGKYELLCTNSKGAVLGLHTVTITTIIEAAEVSSMADVPSDSPEYANQGSSADYAKAANRKELIPDRYNSKTELVEEVTAGSQEINFDLKSK